VEVCILATRASDHNSFLVVFDKREQHVRGGAKSFKFEDWWWLDSNCKKIIEDGWNGTNMHGGPMTKVRSKLE
jgi:hypothetical protein